MKKFKVKFGSGFIILNQNELNNLINECLEAGTKIPEYEEYVTIK